MSDDKYRKPKWQLGDYLRVQYGPKEGSIGRAINIQSFDDGRTPIYYLNNVGEYYEYNLQFYCD